MATPAPVPDPNVFIGYHDHRGQALHGARADGWWVGCHACGWLDGPNRDETSAKVAADAHGCANVPPTAEYELRVYQDWGDGRLHASVLAWCPARQHAAFISQAVLEHQARHPELSAFKRLETWGPGRLNPNRPGGREPGRRRYDTDLPEAQP